MTSRCIEFLTAVLLLAVPSLASARDPLTLVTDEAEAARFIHDECDPVARLTDYDATVAEGGPRWSDTLLRRLATRDHEENERTKEPDKGAP